MTADPWAGAPRAPRKWQAEALPIVLEAMRRKEAVIVSAVMGAGKSEVQGRLCALALRNLRDRRVVVSAPKAALVEQLRGTIARHVGDDRVGVFYGRKKQPDRSVIVACNPSLGKLAGVLRGMSAPVAFALVDEAHSSEPDSVKEAVRAMAPVCLAGFTATPFRSAPKESIELFSRIAYRYTLQDATRDGVLVPLRIERVEGWPDGTLDEVCYRMMLEHGRGPGIVSARDCADADAYAAWLTDRGFYAESIHSGHSRKLQRTKLDGLQTGRLRCLVHVSLLAEGVDFPWLRWLCLRRRVRASVRFWQELGRPARTDPEPDPVWGPKTEAVILDPHLLSGVHGPNVTEAIGRMLEDAADAEAREGSARSREPTEEEATALDVLLDHLDRVHAGLSSAGMAEEKRGLGEGWRMSPVSPRQVEALSKASKLTRHIPPVHREPVRTLLKVPWALDRGACSDLLSVLYGGASWAREIQREEEERTGERPYPNRVQWEPSIVGSAGPGHSACLAAGRAGRKIGRAQAGG